MAQLMDFCERSDIIFISYHGGSGGFAVKVLLGLAPESRVNFINRTVRPDGAAHAMVFRYDAFHNGDPLKGLYHLHRELMPHSEWFDDIHGSSIDGNLISSMQDILNAASDIRGEVLALSTDKIIMVDHIPPRFARLLFPHARLIRIHREQHASYRAYCHKNLLQLAVDDEGRFFEHNQDTKCIDAILAERAVPVSHASYKDLLRQIRYGQMIERDSIISDDTTDVLDIDYDSLFVMKADWYQPYMKLCQWCGLTPYPDLAEQWIKDYADRQYDRQNAARHWNWPLIETQAVSISC